MVATISGPPHVFLFFLVVVFFQRNICALQKIQDANKILDKGKAIAQKTVNHLKNEGEEAVQAVVEVELKRGRGGFGCLFWL